MSKKNIPYILLIISIFFTTILWDKIFIHSNETQTYGVYKQNNYHPINEVLRFVFYISVPLIFYFISYYTINKKRCYPIKEIFLYKEKNFNSNKNKLNNYILILFLFLIILEFLSIDFTQLHKNIDSFHDGVYLSASNNFIYKKGFWTSSFVEYGLINFDSVAIWSVFNSKTIGLAKLLKYIYLLFNKIIIVLIMFNISEKIFINSRQQSLFFLITSLFSISLVDYIQFEASELPSRIFIMLLFQFFFLKILIGSKNFLINSFILGIISAFSIIWTLDMGIFINLLMIFILIFFVARNEIKKIKFIVLGFFLSWLLIFYLLGYMEITNIFQTFYLMLTNNEQAGGLIYPTPFLSGEARFTKALIMYILSGVFLVLFCFKKDFKISSSLKIFFISLFFSSILVFKQALTRSDAAHIKAASGITYILVISIFLFFIFFYTNKNNYFLKLSKMINKKISFRNIIYCSIIFSTIFFFEINFKNIFLFNKKIDIYTSQPNENYLNENQVKLVNFYKKISENDNCIQTITNQAALPFLVNKPSCTKYYTNWYLITNYHQNKFIKELEKSKPRLILYWSKLDLYNFDDEKRIPLILSYLKKNYITISKTEDWHFIEKK